jgi:hypothetical protein
VVKLLGSVVPVRATVSVVELVVSVRTPEKTPAVVGAAFTYR